MKAARNKKPRVVWCCLCAVSTTGQSAETGSRFLVPPGLEGGVRGVGVYGYRVSPFGGGGNWNETRVAAVQHRECTGSHRTAYFKVANFMVCILCQGGAGRGWPSHPHSREQWPPHHPSQGAPAPRPLTQGAATSSAHKFRGRLSPSADHKWQLAPARPQQLRLSPQPRGTSGVKDLPSLQTGKDLSLPARSSLPASSVLEGL